jgi:hypothetical protein
MLVIHGQGWESGFLVNTIIETFRKVKKITVRDINW